jgi:hypothetical protein
MIRPSRPQTARKESRCALLLAFWSGDRLGSSRPPALADLRCALTAPGALGRSERCRQRHRPLTHRLTGTRAAEGKGTPGMAKLFIDGEPVASQTPGDGPARPRPSR